MEMVRCLVLPLLFPPGHDLKLAVIRAADCRRFLEPPVIWERVNKVADDARKSN